MISYKEIIIRLLLASFFGALIGLERERKDWAAGMRTHMMVSVGSSLIMILSAFGFEDILHNDHVSLDPSRVAAQVISGIGFIGAGTILFIRQGTIRGLTTAAGLWTVAAIGLATGGGLYFAAGATTLIAIVILWLMQPIENLITKRYKHKSLKIVVKKSFINDSIIQTILEKEKENIQNYFFENLGEEHSYQIVFHTIQSDIINSAIAQLRSDNSVVSIAW